MQTNHSVHAVRLTNALSTEANRHLSELEGDLAQVRVLLDSSIERLCAGFTSIATLAGNPGEAGNAQEIARQAAGLITELQFHDLTTQILSRSVQRVEGLENLLCQLRVRALELSLIEDPAKAEQEIDILAKQIEVSSQGLSAGLRRKVVQEDLHVGDVELF